MLLSNKDKVVVNNVAQARRKGMVRGLCQHDDRLTRAENPDTLLDIFMMLIYAGFTNVNAKIARNSQALNSVKTRNFIESNRKTEVFDKRQERTASFDDIVVLANDKAIKRDDVQTYVQNNCILILKTNN